MRNSHTRCGGSTYRIKVKGVLGQHWAEHFSGLTVSAEAGVTTISGPIVDQAALHGLLTQIRDLGLPLLLVQRLDPANNEQSRTGNTDESEDV